jgi:hypothetical protein
MSFCNFENQYLFVAGNNHGTMPFSEVEMKIYGLQKEQVKCFRIIVGDSELLTGESRIEARLSLMCVVWPILAGAFSQRLHERPLLGLKHTLER